MERRNFLKYMFLSTATVAIPFIPKQKNDSVVKLGEVGEIVTLVYVDDRRGWVPISYNMKNAPTGNITITQQI